MPKLLVIGTTQKDPVIRSLGRLSKNKHVPFFYLSPKDLLDCDSLWAEMNIPSRINISTTVDPELILEPGDLIVNRISFINTDLFEDFNPQDRDYAKKEFEALIAALNISLSKTNFGISATGYIEGLQSLVYVWEKCRKELLTLDISVPSYGVGHRNANWSWDETIQTSLYNVSCWNPHLKNTSGSLFIQKPKGNPCVIYANHLGEFTESLIWNTLSKTQYLTIRSSIPIILKTLNVKSCELLFFVEDTNVCFCSATPLPLAGYQDQDAFDSINEVYFHDNI